MSPVEQLDDLGQLLLDDLIGREFGELRVVDGLADIRHDSDDQLNLFMTLVLTEPQGVGDGWRTEDLKAVRAAFRELVIGQRTPLVPYLQFASEGDAAELKRLLGKD